MREIDIEHEVFECSRMGGEVTITRYVLIHRSPPSIGYIDKTTTDGIECNGKEECGVGQISGSSMSFDWTRCVHPEMK